ncbi:gap junction delta-4 protein [Dunckerocampus dactyliophorus]|uniref:gap junction delta-4 protein n=1 Tax=Dunckerocampus dactyliophorus TaxID=161453 RepID=UPI0024070123|nr:gap junction delta-4 protein [Dunckerocampus dactyliophorus]
MAGSSPLEIIFISVNHSITFIGKVWLIVMIFLRILILLFAGYPLYQDEQERFICNTIQPGCANVCYDIYSPISLFRFWLVQLITLCLPYVIFTIYVVHTVSNRLTVVMSSSGPGKAIQLYKIQQELSTKKTLPGVEQGWVRFFTGAYILQLIFRTLLEAGFGAAHYYMFGFYIRRRYLCQNPPCTTQVDCYISRPTEKTVMLNFMLGVAALSLFLNVLDFICTIKRSVRQRSKAKMMEDVYEDEYGDLNTCLSQQALEAEAGQKECFGKRQGSRCSNRGIRSSQDATSIPCSLEPLGCNTNGNNGYSASQEEAPEKEGSEVVLCPLEPMGSPKATCVNKRSRLKPPPPPRQNLRYHPAASPRPLRHDPTATAACTRRIGQYMLVELGGGAELSNDESHEKRSEWV